MILKTKNQNFSDIQTEIERLNNDKEIGMVITLVRKYQNVVLSIAKPVFPHLAGRDYSQVVEDDWSKKLTFDKKEITYRTNLFNWIDCNKVDSLELEGKLLDVLQEFVDQGLSQYVSHSLHYNCWQYYYKQQPCSTYNFSLQEIIDHRRSQLK